MCSESDIAWLAGFIDADGCIRLKKGAKNAKKGQNSLIPHITVANVCVLTLNRITAILNELTESVRSSRKKPTSPAHSKLHNVDVMGMMQAKPVLEAVLPYLVTKKLEATLLLRFIDRRQAREHRNKPYVSDDYLIHQAMAYLKKTRHLRDYMPSVEEILNEDIVRTNAKALEEAEMSSRLSAEQRAAMTAQMVWYRWDRSKVADQTTK